LNQIKKEHDMAEKLLIGDLAPDIVYSKLIDQGLSKSDAAIFVGEWIVGEFGKGSRSFNYVQEFLEAKPNCVPKFTRGFTHQDWVDGEDVVQAGETTGEEGFNKRFHAIEKDLDALGQDTANVFACLAEMRREVKNLLSEIRNEFNRLNSLLDKRPGGVIGPIPPIMTFPGVVGTGTILGSIKFGGKDMTLWNTAQGMLMLPAASVINPSPLEDPRTTDPGKFAKFLEERADVRQRFPQAFTKQQFVEAFGRERLEDGTFVRELLALVPETAQFANVDALANDVVDRQAAALRTTPGIETTIFTTLGVDLTTQKPGEASLDKFSALPNVVRTALVRNGIDTVGKLSETDRGRVQEILRNEGVRDVSSAAVADWTTRARTLSRIR
jgi:hypothetical protein